MGLQQAGRFAQARELYESVLKADADHPEANHFLALLLHQSGETEKAIDLIGHSISLAPDNPLFHNNLGTVLTQAGRLEESVQSFRKAVTLLPDYAVAWTNLGVSQKSLGQYDEAIESHRTALRLQPSYVGARLNLANAEKEAGRVSEAIADYRAALALKPNDAETRYHLGNSLMEHGEIDEAVDSFRRAIALKPRHAEAYMMLSWLKRAKEADPEMEAMARLYNRADATDAERMVLAFALAKSHEDIGRYDEAFEYLLAGNAARRASYDYAIETSKREFAHVHEIFQPALFEQFADAGSSDPAPVFVLGMPRSGTTLVEQILASHPDVAGRGEVPILQQVAESVLGGNHESPFPDDLDLTRFAPETFLRAGEDYVAQIRRYSPPEATRITDKLPGNFLFIGLIRLILPKATVLHCVRGAPATCLSIFKTFFRTSGLRYAYDLKELAEYYNLYAALMDHWRTVLPGFVTDVVYEDLIADQERQSRALVAAAGLEWDDRCLSFHTADRPVTTASAAQVRQPIHNRSIKLWQRYEKGLQPLLEGLDPKLAR